MKRPLEWIAPVFNIRVAIVDSCFDRVANLQEVVLEGADEGVKFVVEGLVQDVALLV